MSTFTCILHSQVQCYIYYFVVQCLTMAPPCDRRWHYVCSENSRIVYFVVYKVYMLLADAIFVFHYSIDNMHWDFLCIINPAKIHECQFNISIDSVCVSIVRAWVGDNPMSHGVVPCKNPCLMSISRNVRGPFLSLFEFTVSCHWASCPLSI